MRGTRLLLTVVAAASVGICFTLASTRDRTAGGRSAGVAAQAAPGKPALRLTDARGLSVVEMAAPAPMDVRLPATRYRVSARFSGLPRSATVEVISTPDEELATR